MSHCAGRRSPAPSHTYYYDATAGNNANPGNSEHSPLQTMADFNGRTIVPGDRALFKCGETFDRMTKQGLAGKPGRLVQIGSYGTGARPIVNATSTYNAMLLQNWSHVVLGGLASTATGTAGASLYLIDSSYVWLNDCDLGAAAQNGISIYGTQALNHHITISDCAVHNTTYNGISVYYDTAPGVTDVTIQGCTLTTCGTRTSPADHGIYAGASVRLKVLRTTIISSANQGIILRLGAAGTLVEGCYITTSGRVATNNGIYCEDDTGTIIRNNVFYANVNRGVHINTTSPVSVLHNTFVNNSGGGLFVNLSVGSIIKNNIGYQDSAVVSDTSKAPIIVYGDLAQNTLNYNLWYFDANKPCKAGATLKTLAEWQGLTGTPDVNSLSADPVLVTEYSDFHIQTTSPAKAAGDATVGVLTDYDGVLRGAAVDMGCYEFVA